MRGGGDRCLDVVAPDLPDGARRARRAAAERPRGAYERRHAVHVALNPDLDSRAGLVLHLVLPLCRQWRGRVRTQRDEGVLLAHDTRVRREVDPDVTGPAGAAGSVWRSGRL